MPLHIIGECCKCKSNFFIDIWSISRNHKYSNKYFHVCNHFDVEIDHESSTGLLGWCWSNHIKLYAIYKQNNEKRMIIDEEFKAYNTECQNCKIFSNEIVFHARISDYRDNFPTCGFEIQDRLDYVEKREKQRLVELNHRRNLIDF